MHKDRLYRILIALTPLIASMGVLLFFHSEMKADVYLFYAHERYLDNIFYDISNMMAFTIFSYYASRFDKKAFKPFFWLSILNFLGYFLFYKQFQTLISLPVLAFLIIYYNNEK